MTSVRGDHPGPVAGASLTRELHYPHELRVARPVPERRPDNESRRSSTFCHGLSTPTRGVFASSAFTSRSPAVPLTPRDLAAGVAIPARLSARLDELSNGRQVVRVGQTMVAICRPTDVRARYAPSGVMSAAGSGRGMRSAMRVQLGIHQLASPSRHMSDGTSRARMTVASKMMPAARPIARGLIS